MAPPYHQMCNGNEFLHGMSLICRLCSHSAGADGTTEDGQHGQREREREIDRIYPFELPAECAQSV